jgi:uncharacterized membrane protein
MATESAHAASKRPRSILAGPYGHPFHALLVTIPIGTWTASLVFDIVAIVGDDPEAFAQGARWLIGIGLIGAVLAAVAGFLDYSVLVAGTRAKRVALIHMLINLTVILLLTIGFFVRLGVEGVSVAGVVLSVLSLLLLGVSGFLGGELAYRFGVRVADEKTQREAFEG